MIIIPTIKKTIHASIVAEQDLLQLVIEQFPSIQNILNRFDVPTSSLHLLGSGDKGSAYGGGRFVVKITSDADEAAASANIMKNNQVGGVTKIDYVGKLPKSISFQPQGFDKPLEEEYYLIIQEKVNTQITRIEKETADAMGQFLTDMDSWRGVDKNKTYNMNPKLKKFHNQGLKFFNKPFNQIIPQNVVEWIFFKTGNQISINVAKELLTVLNRLRSIGIPFNDVSGENLGKDSSGNLTLFDIGITKSPPIDIPTI